MADFEAHWDWEYDNRVTYNGRDYYHGRYHVMITDPTIGAQRYYSDDGSCWFDAHDKPAQGPAFDDARIKLFGGPHSGQVVS